MSLATDATGLNEACTGAGLLSCIVRGSCQACLQQPAALEGVRRGAQLAKFDSPGVAERISAVC